MCTDCAVMIRGKFALSRHGSHTMTSAFRKFLLVSSCSVGISALAACSGKDESTADILAQDSTLAREVMSANLDDSVMVSTIDSMAVSLDPVESALAPVASTGSAFGAEAAEPATPPKLRAQPAARATVSQAAKRPRRVARSSAPARTPSGVLASSTRSRSSLSRTKLGGSALIPAGSKFSFASDERICTTTGNVVGRFSTRLAEDIVGPIGVVIPKGAIATGLVAAGANGASDKPERAIHIRSLTFGGRTYNVSSEVTAAKLDKKRTCIPTGGLITARLTAPLRVALGD